MNATRLFDTPRRVSTSPVAHPFRSALIDLCFERGFAGFTVADLCRRAERERAAFDHLYADLHDCLLQISRFELARYHRLASAARAGLDSWRARLRATAYALHRYLGEDERLGQFLLVELRAAGERPALLLDAEIETLCELIDEGRAEPTAPSTLTRATAESLAGGIYTQIHLASRPGGLLAPESELVPVMMYAAVLPYLGVGPAAEELVIAPPPRAVASVPT